MTANRQMIVIDGVAYMEYPDGSHRCIATEDAKWMNEAFDLLWKAENDYRGMASVFQRYGYKASAKEAEETADYLARFLTGRGNDETTHQRDD